MKHTLPGGYHLETTTPAETRELLDAHTVNSLREKARGLGTADVPTWTATVAAGAVAFPGNSDNRMGPRAGLLWAVQRVSAAGLAAGDTLKVYRGTGVDQNFIGNITAAAGFLHIGGHGFLLRGEQFISITGASLTATGVITITGDAIECSELDLYKVLGG